jgi:hypothetical protein
VDGIPPALLNGVGVATLLVVLFWMLAKEHLVTGPAHRRELADKDAQIGRLWETVDSLTESVRKYAVSAETSAHALHELEKRALTKGGDE